MLKNVIALLLAVILVTSFARAHAEQLLEKEAVLKFSPLDTEKLTKMEKVFVAVAKEHRGVHRYGSLYVIALGAKPSSGYGIQFVRQEQLLEQLKIYIKQTVPQAGKYYLDVITYPFIAGRVDLPPYTTLTVWDALKHKPIFDEDTDKLAFENKQLIKNIRKSWTVKMNHEKGRQIADALHISMKEVDGMGLQPIDVIIEQDETKRTVKVSPKHPYRKGTIYVLQIESKMAKERMTTTLPFEIR